MTDRHRKAALALLAQISGTPQGEIRPDMDLVGDLGIDSPKAIELLLELEEALGIEIGDDEAGQMETVGDVLALAERAE